MAHGCRLLEDPAAEVSAQRRLRLGRPNRPGQRHLRTARRRRCLSLECSGNTRQRHYRIHEGNGRQWKRRQWKRKVRQCLSREGSGSTSQRRCLSNEGSETTRRRRCLCNEGSETARRRRRHTTAWSSCAAPPSRRCSIARTASTSASAALPPPPPPPALPAAPAPAAGFPPPAAKAFAAACAHPELQVSIQVAPGSHKKPRAGQVIWSSGGAGQATLPEHLS